MKVIDRYIGTAVIAATGGALVTLVALFGLISFVQEIPEIGTVDYGPVQAVTYVLLTLPRQAFDLFPTAALLGTLLGVGALAVRSELVALRGSGVSRNRISAAALGACLVLTVPVMVLGEWLAPTAEQAAQELKVTHQAENLSIGGPDGLWVRRGDAVINAERLLETGALSGVTVMEFDADRRLTAVTRAALAQPVEDGWQLARVERTVLGEGRSHTEQADREHWPDLVDPELLRVAALKPEDLSIRALDRYIEYLRANSLESYRYEQAFWHRITYPVIVLALVIAGLPFIFGPLRQGGFGLRVFLGIAIGLVFVLATRTLVRFGAVYGIDPLVITLVPPLLVGLLATLYLRRTFA